MQEENKEITPEELAKRGLLVPTNQDLLQQQEEKGEELSLNTRINTPEMLFVLKQAIQQQGNSIRRGFIRIGRFLYLIRRDRAWEQEDCESFQQWITENWEFLRIKQRAVYYLIEIFENLVLKLGVEIKELEQIDQSDAKEICRYATPKNVYELIEMAKVAPSYREFKKSLEIMSKGKGWEEQETGECLHQEIIIQYKCLNCGFVFWQPPLETKSIVDRIGVLNQDKIKEFLKEVEIKKASSRTFKKSKKEKDNLTRGLKKD